MSNSFRTRVIVTLASNNFCKNKESKEMRVSHYFGRQESLDDPATFMRLGDSVLGMAFHVYGVRDGG